jgi:hypothetical protein
MFGWIRTEVPGDCETPDQDSGFRLVGPMSDTLSYVMQARTLFMNFCGSLMFIDSYFLGSPTRWSVRLRKCKRRSLSKGKADEAVAEVEGKRDEEGDEIMGYICWVFLRVHATYTAPTAFPHAFCCKPVDALAQCRTILD